MDAAHLDTQVNTELSVLSPLNTVASIHEQSIRGNITKTEYTSIGSILSGDTIDKRTDAGQLTDAVFVVPTVVSKYDYKKFVAVVDNSITELVPKKIVSAPVILNQPQSFYQSINSTTYTPGKTILIDTNNTINVVPNSTITFNITVSGSGPVTYNWLDENSNTVSNTNQFDYTIGSTTSIFCMITDNYGNIVTSDTITINVVDVNNISLLYNNIVRNGYASEGTNYWNTVGTLPEAIGMFKDIVDTGVQLADSDRDYLTGYHTNTGPGYNMWYPTIADLQEKNSWLNHMPGNSTYFKGGEFQAPAPPDYNHDGLTKLAYQIIDVSSLSNIISGKVYGIEGLTSRMFSWLGGTATQGDRSAVDISFLDSKNNTIADSGDYIISLDIDHRADWVSYDSNWINNVVYIGSPDNKYTGYSLNSNAAITTAGADKNSKVQVYLDNRYIHTAIPIHTEVSMFWQHGSPYNVPSYKYGFVIENKTNVIYSTVITLENTRLLRVPVNTVFIRINKVYKYGTGQYDLAYGSFLPANGKPYISNSLIWGINCYLFAKGSEPVFDNVINSYNYDSYTDVSISKHLNDNFVNKPTLNQKLISFTNGTGNGTGNTGTSATVIIPNLAGQAASAAISALKALGLANRIISIPAPDAGYDQIVKDTDPVALTPVNIGTIVKINTYTKTTNNVSQYVKQ